MNKRQVDFLKQIAIKIPQLISELCDDKPKSVYVLGKRNLEDNKYAELTIQAQSFQRCAGEYPDFSREIIKKHLWELRLKKEWLKNKQLSGKRVLVTVVRANCEKQAREVASTNCLGEGPEVWLMPEASWCFQLFHDGDIGVIVQAVNHDSLAPSDDDGQQ